MVGARLALDKHPEELAAGVLAVVRDGAFQTRGMGTAMTKDQPVTDIVERLRAGFFCREEAADEIERLRAASPQQLEIDSLKGAMRVLEEGYDRIKAERDAAIAQPQTPSDSAALAELQYKAGMYQSLYALAVERLQEINRVCHVPTKATGYRDASRHFQADFDAIRKICAPYTSTVTRPNQGGEA